MSRKKRNAINLTKHSLRYKASEWLHENKGVPFNNPILTEEVGLDPYSRIDTARVYQDVILYWRRKFIEFYYKHKEAGLLDGVDAYASWDLLLYNYNQNDAYVFLFDRKMKQYIQPGFDELEVMDKKRLNRQWKGINTVIDEMKLFKAQLILSDGSKKPVTDLLKAGKSVDKLLNVYQDSINMKK